MMAGVEQPEVQEELPPNNARELRRLRLISWAILIASYAMAAAYLFNYLQYSFLELLGFLLSPIVGDSPLLVGCPPMGFSSITCSFTVFFAHCAGAASWVALPALVNLRIRERIDVLRAGSEAAYQRQIEEANTPTALGELVGVSNSRGGFFSSDQATIETSHGFYRVSGQVGGVTRGAPVYQLQDYLLIGEGDSQRRFLLLD